LTTTTINDRIILSTALSKNFTINGSGGTDTLELTVDITTRVTGLTNVESVVLTGDGTDLSLSSAVLASAISSGLATVTGNTTGSTLEYLKVTGTNSIDTIDVSKITFTNAAAYIDAADSNDTITGGNGADYIIGGKGADTITGGGGADIIRFTNVNELTAGTPDIIVDFLTGAGGDILSFNATSFGINAGLSDQVIDGWEQVASGAHTKDAEITVITTAVSGSLISANAALAIGSATSAYASGDGKFFIVSNGTDSAVFKFTSGAADATVTASELGAGPLITLTGVDSTELNALVAANFNFIA
jgi:Ca2+-binding RTX toxin-like protein